MRAIDTSRFSTSITGKKKFTDPNVSIDTACDVAHRWCQYLSSILYIAVAAEGSGGCGRWNDLHCTQGWSIIGYWKLLMESDERVRSSAMIDLFLYVPGVLTVSFGGNWGCDFKFDEILLKTLDMKRTFVMDGHVHTISLGHCTKILMGLWLGSRYVDIT